MTFSIVASQPKKMKRSLASVQNPTEAGKICAQEILKINVDQKGEITKNSKVSTQITDAFKVCLGQYIQFRTISPKGEEEQAVEYFESIFSLLDIPYKRFVVDDLTGMYEGERVNIVASLSTDRSSVYDWETKTNTKSIILLNHMDVVDANPEQWEKPELTWSGSVAPSEKFPDQEFIWGRGALDMKGIGITQLINMYMLKHMDIKLKRDIHFLAVADEEAAGSGAIGAIQKMQEGEELYALSSASLVLNEGGGGVKDTPSTGWDLFLLATEEKGGAWLKFKENDPVQLLKDLYKSKMIMIDDRISRRDPRIRGHECKIQKIYTPKAKVNVVASKITVTFQCKKGFQAKGLFESVFKHDFKGISTQVVQVGDKVKLTVESKSSSHGSTGVNESAMEAFVMGLYHLDILNIRKKKKRPGYFDYIKTAATDSLVNGLRKSNTVLNIVSRLSWIPFFNKLILKEVENSFGLDGLFRTSCQFSAMNFNINNDSHAEALVDCRLLHTAVKHKDSKNHPEDFIKQVKKTIKNKNLKIDLISGWNVSQSPVKNKDFRLIKKTLEAMSRMNRQKKRKVKSVAVAYLFPAGTDSTWFRNPFSAGEVEIEPIPSYGLFPLYMDTELLASYHGSNERFPVSEIPGTVERYLLVLKKLAARSDISIISRAKNQYEKVKVKRVKKKQSKTLKIDKIKGLYKTQLEIVTP